MKINYLLFLFSFFLCLESYSQDDSYYDKNEFSITRKTNFHLNVSYKNSFHYGRRVLANTTVNNRSGRDIESVKQSPFSTFDIALTINHFLDKRQEIFGGVGVSEHVFEEEGRITYFFVNGSSNVAYSDVFSYEHYYFVVGHRYTFPARGLALPFIENSLQSDWLIDDPSFAYPANYFSRNGYSYKFHLGIRSNEMFIVLRKKELRINFLASIFFQSAIVKYNVKKIDRNYFPYAYGINFALAFGK